MSGEFRIQSQEKRLVLVVDDELVNREMLGMMIGDAYDLIFAADGQEALAQIKSSDREISLILLDLMMPVMSGMMVLRRLAEAPAWSKIPVIVMTSDTESEAICLELGAVDFISKPYPSRDIILARIRRIIELSEDRELIGSTERDPVTGLYNREFFYSYAAAFDQHHRNSPMDCIVVDICRFHLLVERLGRTQVSSILNRIGSNLREMVRGDGGIVSRREEDTFMVYCPHRADYRDLLDQAAAGIGVETENEGRIRLCMGVYENADRSIGLEQRFERAKVAADRARGNYNKDIEFYNTDLHEAELLAVRLAEDFERAIRDREFRVFYQPQFDVQHDQPLLCSAEALVRWQHPKLGLVSPGRFIPVFEKNGMIRRLDNYVWEEAARQIAEWKKTTGMSVPVAVNVSRIDITDPGIIPFFEKLLADYDVEPSELSLEVTESAYADDEEYIIDTVQRLRRLGLKVEMDDFGTGYSSLSMLSQLPIDALKLDMSFVRNAFSGNGDARMIRLVLDIAGYLDVPVIAEGVENLQQVSVLKGMGCQIIQGHCFSKAVPADEMTAFLEEKKQRLEKADPEGRQAPREEEAAAEDDHLTFARIAQALSQDYFTVYYLNTETGDYREYRMQGEDHRLLQVAGGTDFFEDCMKQIPERIVPEDQDRVRKAFEKLSFLDSVRGRGRFSIKYQTIVDGIPMNVNTKAIRLADDRDHIVIGLSNIDAEVRREREYHEALEKSVTYASLAKALAADYFSIYYVDTETDRFTEFTANAAYEDLGIEKAGENFFQVSRQNVRRVIHPEDQGEFLRLFTKKNLLRELDKNGAFTISYRLVFDGNPAWVSMKAIRMGGSRDNHIVIGVNNIDLQMKRHEKYEDAKRENLTYSRILYALSKDYYSIYMVNTETDEFVEYSSNPAYRELKVEQTGRNFFAECRKNVLRLAHPNDLKKALFVWEKERLLRELEDGRPFSVTYRLMFDGTPVYVSCKVIRLTEDDGQFIVIGISNVNEQMKREKELDQDLELTQSAVMKDPLTGVKSRDAFMKVREEIDRDIASGIRDSFAVAVFDVINLKEINNTLGHEAGDQCIRQACSLICNQFKRSPVFRIGGDEFAAILMGPDYLDREKLAESFSEQNRAHQESGGLMIAFGISEWSGNSAETIEKVFGRADAAMREDKKKRRA